MASLESSALLTWFSAAQASESAASSSKLDYFRDEQCMTILCAYSKTEQNKIKDPEKVENYKVIQKGSVLPYVIKSTQLIHMYRGFCFFFLPLICLFTLLILSHPMALL